MAATCTLRDASGHLGVARDAVATPPGSGAGAAAGAPTLAASLGLAAAVATSGLHLPWLRCSASHVYPLITPPHGAVKEAAIDRARRSTLSLTSGFQGIFSARSKAGNASAPLASGTQQRQQQPVPGQIAAFLDVSPAGRTTAIGKGALNVRILAARHLLNTDTGLFGDVSDPYVVARIGSTQHRTPTINNNLDPAWHSGNEFTFTLDDADTLLELEVMNANIIKDDSLGHTRLGIWSLLPGDWQKQRLPLEGHGCGELELEVRIDYPPGARLVERLVDPPGQALAAAITQKELPSAATSLGQTPRSMHAVGSFALPPGWDEDDAEGKASGDGGAAAGSRRGSRCGSSEGLGLGWPFAGPSKVQAISVASGGIVDSLESGGGADSQPHRPRSGSIRVPDDLFGEPRLEVGDPTAGPAAAWERAVGGACTAEGCSGPWKGTVRALAQLDEALVRGERSGGGSSSVFYPAQRESEEAALAQALKEQGAARQAAEAELARTLARLNELQGRVAPRKAASVAPPAVSASKASQIGADAVSAVAATLMPASPVDKIAGASAPASAGQSAAAARPTVGSSAISQPAAKPATPRTDLAAGAPEAAMAARQAASAAPCGGHREHCQQLVARLQEVEGLIQNFKQDASQKDFRLKVKKSLNTKVGQISATWNRIQDCTLGLSELLSEHMQDPSAPKRHFTEYSMAERLADDAEVGIKAQPRAAWPIAQVAGRIFAQFPAIDELFRGFMYRACPYLVPDYAGSHAGRPGPAPGQRPGEPYTDFVDRMVSYQRLWLAILVTCQDIGVVWQWLARTLNEPPAPIAATLLHSALDLAGADAQARYRRQFVKLVAYVDREYMRELEVLQGKVKGEEADQLRASLSRLRHWLDSFRERGRASLPIGRHIEVTEEEELNPDA